MTEKWVPVYGTYDCPGKIRLKVDELGIVIERGRKALATTEWPSEDVRLCELREEPDTAPLTEEVKHALLRAILRYRSTADTDLSMDDALLWLDSQ